MMKFVLNIDWQSLRDQKLWLLQQDCKEASGIVNMLDDIQDQAINRGLSELEVFGKDYIDSLSA